MYSHEAANLFTDHIGIDRNSYLNHDAAKMIDDEAKEEIDRGDLKGQRNQYSKAVGIAVARMMEWYNNGLQYHFDSYHDFIASHRRACAWCVFLRRSVDERDGFVDENI